MLNIIQVRNAKPKEKLYHLNDGDGLMLRVFPNGKKKWILSKSIKGKRICKSIGEFPEISIKDAREAAALIDHEERTLATEEVHCFREVFEKWIELKKTQIKNWDDIVKRVEKYLLPALGKISIRKITPLTIISILERELASRQKYETIKRICGYLKEMEIFAFNRGQIKTLQWQNIAATFPSPKARVVNRPSIPWKELPEAMQILQTAGIKARATWEVLLCGFYTLLRPGEYSAIEWSWVDFENRTITVPAETMKMKRPHVVPISSQLEILLKNRPHVSKYVFPATQGKSDRPFATNAMGIFLRRHGFKDRLVPHGIRSIGRTWMHDHDVPFDVAEKCLAHTVGNETVLAYDRSDLLEKRKGAMQEWCDYVEQCLNC